METLEILRKNASIRMEKYETEESSKGYWTDEECRAFWAGVFDALCMTIRLLKQKVKTKTNTYDYEETPIKCQGCGARCFGLVKNIVHKRKIVCFVCPVCEQELHYALLELTGQIEH